MPQIWMTYDEVAGLLGCGLDEARRRVQHERLDCKKSRDGRTRVKLGLAWVGLFIERLKCIDPIDRAIHDLRAIHDVMLEQSPTSGGAQMTETLPRQMAMKSSAA
jgi:hypothetical protein